MWSRAGKGECSLRRRHSKKTEDGACLNNETGLPLPFKMASRGCTIRARTAFLGFAFLLVCLESITDVTLVCGENIELRRRWDTGDPRSSPNYRHRDASLLEHEYGAFPERHWHSWDNAHKKKQFPRSSKRNAQDVRQRSGRVLEPNYALRANAERASRTSAPLNRPTIRPAGNFNARQDAEKLLSAMRTKPLNDEEIISIITKRTDDQRQAIAIQYPNLKEDFSLRLSFGFRELMKALAIPLHEFYAHQLNEAFRFTSKLDENLVIELLCTLNNRQLKSVRQAYRAFYKKDVDDELRKFSGNPLANFLISYTSGRRDERNGIDNSLATYDAQQLKNAGKLKIDEGTPLMKILISRSFPQLKLTFSEYKRITGKTIKEAIRKDFPGNVQKGLVNIVNTVWNRPRYFAEILNAAIKNFSKRDATLIRVILLRSEIDLGDIKSAYSKLYNIELSASIPTNTGSLKKALISMLGD